MKPAQFSLQHLSIRLEYIVGLAMIDDPGTLPVAAIHTTSRLAAGKDRSQPIKIAAPTEQELEDWV